MLGRPRPRSAKTAPEPQPGPRLPAPPHAQSPPPPAPAAAVTGVAGAAAAGAASGATAGTVAAAAVVRSSGAAADGSGSSSTERWVVEVLRNQPSANLEALSVAASDCKARRDVVISIVFVMSEVPCALGMEMPVSHVEDKAITDFERRCKESMYKPLLAFARAKKVRCTGMIMKRDKRKEGLVEAVDSLKASRVYISFKKQSMFTSSRAQSTALLDELTLAMPSGCHLIALQGLKKVREVTVPIISLTDGAGEAIAHYSKKELVKEMEEVERARAAAAASAAVAAVDAAQSAGSSDSRAVRRFASDCDHLKYSNPGSRTPTRSQSAIFNERSPGVGGRLGQSPSFSGLPTWYPSEGDISSDVSRAPGIAGGIAASLLAAAAAGVGVTGGFDRQASLSPGFAPPNSSLFRLESSMSSVAEGGLFSPPSSTSSQSPVQNPDAAAAVYAGGYALHHVLSGTSSAGMNQLLSSDLQGSASSLTALVPSRSLANSSTWSSNSGGEAGVSSPSTPLPADLGPSAWSELNLLQSSLGGLTVDNGMRRSSSGGTLSSLQNSNAQAQAQASLLMQVCGQEQGAATEKQASLAGVNTMHPTAKRGLFPAMPLLCGVEESSSDSPDDLELHADLSFTEGTLDPRPIAPTTPVRPLGEASMGPGKVRMRMPIVRVSTQQVSEACGGFAEALRMSTLPLADVFAGSLLGCQVAIVRLDDSWQWSDGDDFMARAAELVPISHPSLALLMACCPESKVLIYDFSGCLGTLQQRLLGAVSMGPLTWQRRVHIIADVCNALVLLQQQKPPIAAHCFRAASMCVDAFDGGRVFFVGINKLGLDPVATGEEIQKRGTACLSLDNKGKEADFSKAVLGRMPQRKTPDDRSKAVLPETLASAPEPGGREANGVVGTEMAEASQTAADQAASAQHSDEAGGVNFSAEWSGGVGRTSLSGEERQMKAEVRAFGMLVLKVMGVSETREGCEAALRSSWKMGSVRAAASALTSQALKNVPDWPPSVARTLATLGLECTEEFLDWRPDLANAVYPIVASLLDEAS